MAEKGIDGSLLGSGRDETDFLGTERGGPRWNMMFRTVWGRNMAERSTQKIFIENGWRQKVTVDVKCVTPPPLAKQQTAS